MEKQSKLSIMLKGFIKENPVFVLVLGTCPTLAVTDSVSRALSMGIAAAIVLICSNMAISALRKVIPDKVRIPAYIVIIAGFVTIIQMLMNAYLPDLFTALGTYLALIVVNCIILGRAEMFASKHTVVESALDGIGMGGGFTLALFCMGTVREILGSGSFLGFKIPFLQDYSIPFFTQAAGGFFVFGVLIAVAPQAFAHVCEVKDNMPMACHYTAQAELGIGVVIALLGIIALFCSPKIRTGLNIAVALNALLSLAVPTVLIGVCKGAMMHCHMVTRPTLIVIGILALLFAVVAIYLDSKPVKR